MASKGQDPKIGHIQHADTKVCAITGQAVSDGMQRFSLRDGWYFRVKPSRVRDVDDALKASLEALIPVSEKVKKDEVKS